MYGFDQIGSTLGDFIDAVFHPSVANLPAGFLVLVFAVLMIAAMPEGAGEDAFGQPSGGRTDRQFDPNLAGDLGDPALKTTAAASGRPPVQIATAKLFDLRRNAAYPSPTKPSSIIAQVDGSGTAVTEKAFPSIELSADPALPAKSL